MSITIDYFLNEIKDAEKSLSDSKVALSIAESNASNDVDELERVVSMNEAILGNARCNLYRFENGKMFHYKGRYLTLPNSNANNLPNPNASKDVDERKARYEKSKAEHYARREEWLKGAVETDFDFHF
jgi:hypothetical protein